MQAELTLNQAQFRAMKAALDGLDMPPRKRRRLLYRMLKLGVMVAARRHQKKQQDADGAAWAPRADKRTDKMMRFLPGLMAIREMPATDAARIILQGAKKVPPGVVALAQQEGMTATVTAAQRRTSHQEGGCTLRQAKRLYDLGYMHFPVSVGMVSPVSEIMVTLSQDKAGVIIREMEGREPVRSWRVKLPAREWLAVSDDEFDNILVRQLKAIDFGWRVKAQDIRGKTT
ncbi:hypothetical protein [Klebsiella michiganensis]|uniref:hypothetical protein n=1 Tax=Klebsiella michiganensis TaxID=1134687 RepID=UPI0015F587BB|nr:hypothetical protein [Klebsiella michiganensis]MCZ0065075.1 hypothetical protein [Klebsiella michiganensis]MCZ0081074.1 hypothetical protein [Klebsiella michiganensis]WAT39972.1 hypothetical protein OEE44_27125 [Klebsiella michiganensis]WAX84764.1 hypothetical protein F0A14_027955 [Klebsiella michiganensis]HDX8870165.1 hypothetical protein [Klebsiella michiganensis]